MISTVICVSLCSVWHLCSLPCVYVLFRLISIARYAFKSPCICFWGTNMKITLNKFAYLQLNLLGQTQGFNEYNTNVLRHRGQNLTMATITIWGLYKFCVDIWPDFPVPYLTLKEHLHIWQQSFARFKLFFTAFFGVSAPSMKKFDHPLRKSLRAMHCHVCLQFASLLLDGYLTHVKCRLDTSWEAEFKNQ